MPPDQPTSHRRRKSRSATPEKSPHHDHHSKSSIVDRHQQRSIERINTSYEKYD